RPHVNGKDLTGRRRNRWIVDFGVGRRQDEAALYEAPFEYIARVVRPIKEANRRASRAERWWLHAEAAANMRSALSGLDRYIGTPRVTKHRLFLWLDPA